MNERIELDSHDRGFAPRLALRDESVLNEIDKAYSGHLRRLLRRYRGGKLNEDDIDEVIQDVLKALWNNYDPCRGTVRAFYFRVGKCRLCDHLRKVGREQTGLIAAQNEVAIDYVNLSKYSVGSDAAVGLRNKNMMVMKLVDEAVESLTPRQGRAFRRRSGAGDGESWAKQLEVETGQSAKSWRKASDEAYGNVRAHLIANGVRYSREGGCYEVA